MRRPIFDPAWPPALKKTYLTDQREFLGDDQGRNFSPDYRARFMSRHTKIIELVRKYVPAGGSIIDVGASNGNFSIAMCEEGYHVTWNDLREHLVEYVRQKDTTGRLRFLAGNAFEMSTDLRESFDGVLATEIIEHVAHPDVFISQLANLVRPGGHIIMSTPNGAYFLNRLPRWSDVPDPSIFEANQFMPDGDGHLFLLYEDEIRRFAKEAKLDLVSLEYISNPLTVGQMKLRYLHKVIPAEMSRSIENGTRRLPLSVLKRTMKILAFVLRKPGAADQ